MKTIQVHGIYLTKEQQLQGGGGQLVDEGSRGLGLALRLLAVRGVQSCVRAEPGEPVEQALGSPLQHRHTRPQDVEYGKKDS
jgi:hypothetical protein